MTDTKWHRRALLGGAALTVMASGAQADELSALKGQLEALQSRVNTLEQQPAPSQASQLPPGASFMTVEHGSRMDFVAPTPARDMANYNDDAGFTIAVTPTADMPAPVAEITVYGYVKGDVIYDLDGMQNKFSFSMPSQDRFNRNDDEYVFMHALQSRFGIKSKVDTAIGQIRSHIEGDFFGLSCIADGCDTGRGESFAIGTQYTWRLRQAYGEWDMTPNWTLLAGQADYTGLLSIIGVELVDNYADAGINGVTRRPQVRLTYHDGPVSWAVSMERPTEDSNTLVPDFASYLTYDITGGHQLIIAGNVADLGQNSKFDRDNREFGWIAGAGANINLADIATLTAGGQYTQGLGADWMNDLFPAARGDCRFNDNDPDNVFAFDCRLVDAWGVTAGLTFNVNETTSINIEGGFAQTVNADENGFNVDGTLTTPVDHVWTVHGNILWQPVKQMRMGWEVMWGKETYTDAINLRVDDAARRDDDRVRVCAVGGHQGDHQCQDDSDALRIQWGTWFFF